MGVIDHEKEEKDSKRGGDDSDEDEEGNAVLHDKANNWDRLTGTSLDLAQPSLSLHHPHCLLLAKKNFEFGCVKSSHKSCSSKCFSHMKMILQALPAMDGQLSNDTDECNNLLELGALCMFSYNLELPKLHIYVAV